MGSYENIVKLEEMRRRIEEGDLASAQKILDTMETRKIKNVSDLNLMAEVYSQSERYDEAAELYLKIYEKNKTRRSLYQLIDISIKRNDEKDAESFLKQYEKIAPNDLYRYIFRYKIDKLKGEAYEQLIASLDALKKEEYIEQWAYELAKLYYKAGMEKECIKECSDIILWFGEGNYVEKAKMLRSYYSGESDKARIMDEIKRRAEEVSGDNEQSNIDMEKSPEQNDMEYEEEYPTKEFTNYPETMEDIITTPDYEPDEEEFEDALKKGVQDILLDETTEDSDSFLEGLKGGNHAENRVDDVTEYRTEDKADDISIYGNNAGEFYAEEEDTSTDESLVSEKELAEQEVEETIYQLLEEDNIDEEDRKLNEIANEQKINPEEIFGNFLHVLSIKKQLVKSLEIISKEKNKTILMIITGAEGSGKTTLAKDIALYLNKTGKLKSSKVARISADKLNSVDLMSKTDTLRDCCLVIEEASGLKRRTIEGIMDLTMKLQGDIAVIFEEDKKNMNKLFRECPKLMDLLKNRIHLPQYTGEELLGFAYACLRQQDYKLHPKAETLLRNKINQIAKQSEPHSYLENIYNLMQSVMNAADIRTGKQLTDLATQGRLKDVEVLSVLPEDF